MNKYFPHGKLVAVHLPNTDLAKPLQRFDGCCYHVRDVVRFKKLAQFMYTLGGVKSEKGVHYWFADEWLREVE